MKSGMCIPKLRATATCSVKSHGRLSPMSLLQRFREAVFRLMMISALSKASSSSSAGRMVRRASYHRYLADPYHSEAVADCIEFIKKTAVTDDNDEEEEEGHGRVVMLQFD
ncbi:hypothetical protein LINPERHAP2_LOCUS37151 [Linum perenne]